MTRPKRHATPPSNGVKFQPGVSGNPGGRPKWLVDHKALFQEHAEEAVRKLVEIMRGSPKVKDQLGAAQYILDRAFGKPVQAISGDPDGAPIQITGLTVSFVSPKPDSTVSSET